MATHDFMDLYSKAICNAHGENHPEVYRVRELYLELLEAKNLNKTFKDLKNITNNYKIPDDVCDSYVAVYEYLENEHIKYEKNRL